MVLDALNYIKSYVDGSLSFRWSCRMGICGSCGMNVNGTPTLTCASFLRDFYPREVVVEPLSNFPVIRDLVIDMSDFMHKLSAIQPWIIREHEKPISEGEYLQTPGATRRVSPVQRLHQLHALLRGLPRLRHGAGVPGAGGDRAGPAL